MHQVMMIIVTLTRFTHLCIIQLQLNISILKVSKSL